MAKFSVQKLASYTGHKDCVYALERSAIPSEFFSAAGDGMVVRWNTENPDVGELVAKVANSVYALHYLEKENHLLVGQNFEGIHQIDVVAKKEVRSAKITSSHIFDIKTSDKFILVGCGDGELIVLSREDLSTISRIKLSDKSIRTIAINPHLGCYAVGLSDFSIRVFSFHQNRLLFNIEAHNNSVFTLAFTADGKYLISGSRDAHLKVWDCEQDFQLHKSIVAHLFAINHIDMHPDGIHFATASMDKTIKLWDATNWQLVKVIDKARYAGHGTSVNRLLWLSEKQLVSGSDDRTVSLWDIEPIY